MNTSAHCYCIAVMHDENIIHRFDSRVDMKIFANVQNEQYQRAKLALQNSTRPDLPLYKELSPHDYLINFGVRSLVWTELEAGHWITYLHTISPSLSGLSAELNKRAAHVDMLNIAVDLLSHTVAVYKKALGNDRTPSYHRACAMEKAGELYRKAGE